MTGQRQVASHNPLVLQQFVPFSVVRHSDDVSYTHSRALPRLPATGYTS